MASKGDILAAIAVVQCYIHAVRGKEIDIRFDPSDQRSMQLLKIASDKARKFFRSREIKVVPKEEYRKHYYQQQKYGRENTREGHHAKWWRRN